MESVEDLVRHGVVDGEPYDAVHRYIKALGKGVLKVMSKMGVSTVASYTGAQIFEALGLAQDLVDDYFTGTTSRLGGVGLDVIAEEVAARHRHAYPRVPHKHRTLWVGGEYQWRREGEAHLFNPQTVFKLQHATRSRQYDVFKEYTTGVDEQAARLMTLRGLFRFADGVREPVADRRGRAGLGDREAVRDRRDVLRLDLRGGARDARDRDERDRRQVQHRRGRRGHRPAARPDAAQRDQAGRERPVRRHQRLPDQRRRHPDQDGAGREARRGRPAAGPQGLSRGSRRPAARRPGVGLISPPPHHDIYSIEDLKQLIHDLKNANPSARVHVKLVAEVGVGTVAAGVSKAHADVVLISGHDGGTGAAPLTSLKHAGSPWELGLAETQQTLLLNGLRDRITVQVDGQMKTGRDVVIAALLGAEEFGFATAPLVVSGCIMMRVCHLDTCPVGVATQNPELRKRFTGKPEFVQTFFEFIAEEVREHLAALGFRSIDGGGRPRRAARHDDRRSSTGRPPGSTSRRSSTRPDVDGRPRVVPVARTTGWTRRSTTRWSSSPRARCRTRSRCGSSCRSATSTGPSARSSATRSPSGTPRPGCRTTRST